MKTTAIGQQAESEADFLIAEGFEIRALKLNQMDSAARISNQQRGWSGDYRLSAVEVTGIEFSQVSIQEIV